jgi:hypothetical protein
MGASALRAVDFSIRGKGLKWILRERKAEMRWDSKNRRNLKLIKALRPVVYLTKKQKVLATILSVRRIIQC